MSFEIRYSNRVDYDTENLVKRISVYVCQLKELMDSDPNRAAMEARDALIRTGVIGRNELRR